MSRTKGFKGTKGKDPVSSRQGWCVQRKTWGLLQTCSDGIFPSGCSKTRLYGCYKQGPKAWDPPAVTHRPSCHSLQHRLCGNHHDIDGPSWKPPCHLCHIYIYVHSPLWLRRLHALFSRPIGVKHPATGVSPGQGTSLRRSVGRDIVHHLRTARSVRHGRPQHDCELTKVERTLGL